MQGGYTQAITVFALRASKLLVNGRPNEVVNIASTKRVKKFLPVPVMLGAAKFVCTSVIVKTEMPGSGSGHSSFEAIVFA